MNSDQLDLSRCPGTEEVLGLLRYIHREPNHSRNNM